MIRFLGIRKRLVLLILAVALPLFALSLTTALLQQRQAVQQASEKLQFSASLAAAGQDRITASANLLLLAIANGPVVRHGTPSQCQEFFDGLRGEAPIYANIGVVDLTGDIRCQTLAGSRAGGNAADRAYFREAIATRSFAGGEYAIGRVSKLAVVGFARPVLDTNGNVTAVAFAALNLHALSEALTKLDLPAGVQVAITDRNGTVLASTPDSPEVIGQPIADPILKDAASRMARGVASGKDASGAQRLYAFAPGVGQARRWFFVSVSTDQALVTAASQKAMLVQLTGLILAVALGIFAAWRIGTRHVLQPAEQLVQAAQRVAGGHLDARLASERRYEALFEHAPLPMWVSTEDGSAFLAVNQAMHRQYGYTQDEFSRLSLFDLRPESEHQRLARRLAVPANERGKDVYWLHKRKDGSIFEVEVMTTPVVHMGKPAVFAIVNDISARARAEQEVHRHILSLQRLAAASQAIAGQRSLEGIASELTLFARDILECSHAGFVPAPVAGADGRLAVDAGATVAETSLDVPLCSAEGNMLGVLHLSGKSSSGFSRLDHYLAAELAHVAASSMEKALLIDDISALNASLELRVLKRTAELEEQRAMFRALAEGAPQIVWMVDKDGAVTYLNRSWYELTGSKPPQGLGQTWTQYVHPDDRAEMERNWAKCRADGTLYTGQRRIRAQDGRYRSMAYRAAPVVNGGQATFWVGVDADITDIKATENALRQSNAELEAFSYTVSHDLRSPLAAIDGFAKLLGRQLADHNNPKARHYLDRIGAGISRMGQLIEAMLFLAQVSRAQMHWATVDLSAMAREIAAELREADPRRRITVSIDDGLLAVADSRLMQVILQNLLGNAWKFSSRTAAASVSLTREPDGVFCVQDNGVGFDMAYAGRLFGTFERLHTEAEFPGTGIGLATVKRAVERHGGRIWAWSDPGVATRFYFTLSESPKLHAAAESPPPRVTANSR